MMGGGDSVREKREVCDEREGQYGEKERVAERKREEREISMMGEGDSVREKKRERCAMREREV